MPNENVKVAELRKKWRSMTVAQLRREEDEARRVILAMEMKSRGWGGDFRMAMSRDRIVTGEKGYGTIKRQRHLLAAIKTIITEKELGL